MGLGKDGEGGEGRGPVISSPRQRIGLAIGCSPPVDDVVGVGRQSRRPPGMPPGRSAGLAEILQVLMIRVDQDRGGRPLQVDPPLFECFHHREEFFVVDRVVQLSWGELAGVVADRVQLAIGVLLGQDAA